MPASNEPVTLCVQQIVEDNQYTIPLYQRNYAWGQTEINQLLEDVYNKFEADPDSYYYIGTFVTDPRSDGAFELIDGQQRNTTLTLVHAVVQHFAKEGKKESKLNFDARPDVKNYINMLFDDYEAAKRTKSENIEISNIMTAVTVIETFIKGKGQSTAYQYYFYNHVHAIRVTVPEETDINQYFEVMNNRGEQLEMHEILKAHFMSLIKNSTLEKKFALLWEACSQMDRHIQSCFSGQERIMLFGNDYTHIERQAMSGLTVADQANYNGDILSAIIAGYQPPKDFDQNKKGEGNSRFTSIIDFPNFLLQVLRLSNDAVALDDKQLLAEFGYLQTKKGAQLPEPIAFINELFYYRVLFDRFVIKREQGNNDWSWDLSKPKKDLQNGLYFVNTFGTENDENEKNSNKRMEMLQSMLHVSSPGNNYKNWLQKVLQYLRGSGAVATPDELRGALMDFIEAEFQGIQREDYNKGVHTRRLLFNFLDYQLWEHYERSGMTKELSALFRQFKFTANNSVEHMFPQNSMELLAIAQNETDETFKHRQKIMDHFGNLCLIGRGSNSKYNNYNFEAKKEQFTKRKTAESLKQALMFCYPEWNTQQIKAHAEDMRPYLSKDLIH